ncbi:hypothetical protein NLU13_7141 [Sarocladium strictum]|uniref:Uncharacterized protein n=1 Tax=Sarocladium strictum TaxID=5046 RepID=A0AA39L6J5_SARSR|nr:hypothetical protein NLU13_7141 [Sarocladium strictum]
MNMELETDTRPALEFLSARQRDGFAGRSFDRTSVSTVHNQIRHIAEVPRYAPPTLRLTDMLGRGQYHSAALATDDLPQSGAGLAHHNPSMNTPKPSSCSFRFEKDVRSNWSFKLPHSLDFPTRGIKRRRHTQDVDGPNTAGLCCKKRRLRAELITSRLSQPFSQPATHILNREGAESGDKRFLKMATSVDTIRRIAHLHATSFLRFSVMNRIRKRLGIGRPGYQQQRMQQGLQPPNVQPREVDATSKAPWQPQSLQIAAGASFWRPSGVVCDNTSGSTLTSQADRRLPQNPKSSPPVPRVSNPAALPMPASDLAAAKERTASRIHSVPSPELRPDKGNYDDLEEDSFAFLHPDFDDYGDDDPEHVYSDFGAIFRSGSPDAHTGDDHSYEEYLDELDGISWVTR